MSVDFEIPPDVLSLAPKPTVVPLTLMEKGSLLTDFDLDDEAGHSVPLCTASFTSDAACALLVTAARGCGAPEELVAIVRGIGAVDPQEGQAALGRYHAWRRSNPWRMKKKEEEEYFETLMHDLATRFMLLAQPRGDLTCRRILKLRYEFPGAARAGPALLNPGRFGLGSTRLTVAASLPVVSACRSYHMEVEAPQGTRPRDVSFEVSQVIDGIPYRMRSPRRSRAGRITGTTAHIQGTLLEPQQKHTWKTRPAGLLGRARVLVDPYWDGIASYEEIMTARAFWGADVVQALTERRRARHHPRPLDVGLAFLGSVAELCLALVAGAVAVTVLLGSGVPAIRLARVLLFREPRPAEPLKAVVRLYPDPQGLPAAGAMTALFAAAVIAAGAWNQAKLFPQTSPVNGLGATAATVLLAIPAAFAGIAARPMHSVTAKRYLPLRLLLLAVSGASIVAAASLLRWPPGAPPGWLWWMLAGVSAGIMLLFLVAVMVASIRTRQPPGSL